MNDPGKLKTVVEWLRHDGRPEIVGFEAAGGGCINETGILTLADGQRLFIKLHQQAPENFFRAEAAGLDLLRDETALKVPQVVRVSREFLLLEYLGRGTPVEDFWERLGEGLVQLHTRQYASFGLETDNFCGRTPQCNTPTPDGYGFFVEHRLNALAEKAGKAGLLDTEKIRRIDKLGNRLPDLVPSQPPVLIHGDLWSGNVHCENGGHPALIDPACYRGWAEADLAMTQLFGGFSGKFYRTYEALSGIDKNWRERAPLYNLYHLLNHLLLFGRGYLGQVSEVVDRYS